jgi:hypothetical protein
VTQSVPRIVPTPHRPLFGDSWPDPPTARAVDNGDSRYLEAGQEPIDEATLFHDRAVDRIIASCEGATGFLLELRDWLRKGVADHRHENQINGWVEELAGIAEHYQREHS